MGGGNTDFISAGHVVNEEGDVIMVGYTRSFPTVSNSRRTWVIRTDSIGNVEWQRTYNGLVGVNSSAARLSMTESGDVLIAGGNDSYGTFSDPDGFLMKIDTAGNEIWVEEYPVFDGQGLWDVKELDDGNIVSCGVTFGDDDSQAGWLIKTNADGEMLWSRTFNPSGLIDFIRFMLVMENGDIVMLGNGRAPGETIQDGWVLRVDSEGCLVEGCSVGVEELEEEGRFFKAYPNPFTNTTTITYDLGKECELGCQLVLDDIQGRMILNEMLYSENGKGQFEVDMSRYRSGLYYCTLYGNQQLLQTEKLILMR